MSFRRQTCSHCFTTYEYYQALSIVPNCPYCGAYANGWAPMTPADFYKSMGLSHDEVGPTQTPRELRK